MKVRILLITLSLAATSPVSAKTMATCGEISGHAYYADEGHWAPDFISSSNYLFERDEKGVWNIYYRDALKKLKSVRDEGGIIVQISPDDDADFMLGVGYPGYKQFEVYSLVTSKDGSKSLYYTINRSARYADQDMTKVSAMIAKCD